MKKIFLKRLVIFVLIVLGCVGIMYFLSEGSILVPDASRYRKALYSFTFYILPIILMINIFYLFSSLVKNVLTTLIISLLLGFIGPLFLIYAVHSSKDPMAAMALLGLEVFYAIASSVTFIGLALLEVIKDRLIKDKS
ncbi:MAG: hypothetical protein AB7I18_00890 [Candidatus Berkiella sp.]